MIERLLSGENLTKIYDVDESKKYYGIDSISLSISEGEALGLIGEKGAGKSTLLKALADETFLSYGVVEFLDEVTLKYVDCEEAYALGDLSGDFADIYFVDNIERFPGDVSKIYDRLLALKSRGVTLIFASDNLEFVKKFASRTVWLENGKIRALGESERVISRFLKNKERIAALPEEEREELLSEAEELRTIVCEENPKSSLKVVKKLKKDKGDDFNGLVLVASFVLIVTLVSAILFIRNVKSSDASTKNDVTPAVDDKKEEAVEEISKEYSYAVVKTKKFTGADGEFRGYLNGKQGEVIDSITIYEVDEKENKVKAVTVPNFLQVRYPSYALNDQIKYMLVAESRERLLESLNEATSKKLDGLIVVSGNTLKSSYFAEYKDGVLKFSESGKAKDEKKLQEMVNGTINVSEKTELPTKKVELESLLTGVRNIPAQYKNNFLVYVGDIDNSQNVIVKGIKKKNNR